MTLFAHPAWAQSFPQVTWADCLAEAHRNNPELISAQEAVVQKEAAKTIVKSGVYPQVSASAGATASKAESSKRTESYSAGVSGSQLLFDANKTGSRVEAAGETLKAAQQGYRFTSADVRYGLRSAFVNLLKAQELIAVNRDIARMRRDNLELITLRYQSGLEHRGALLTAEANAASAQFSLTQAQRSIETAQRKLCKEMGRQDFAYLEVSSDFDIRESPAGKPDLETLAGNHPSTLQSLANKNVASFNIKAAQADFFPKLTGSAGATKTGTHLMPDNGSWDAGLSLTMPVFEGGLRFAQVAQARAAFRQAAQDALSTSSSVIVDMQSAWQGFQDAVDGVAVSKKSLEAAGERSNIAEAQYATGFISFDSWIIIQNDLVNAKRSFLEARANALLAEAAWIKAKGETIEYAQK
ncbi:MAG: TolC family protein [Candidatus Omnitrophica bacterium]|nr:TolC family protein [Candidatus Omnitrophota bacterium]